MSGKFSISYGSVPVSSFSLPGMENHEAERAEVNALDLAAGLTAELLKPKGDIEAKAGALETFAPLFRGTEASPQAELFGGQS